jgi:hypothetical protein
VCVREREAPGGLRVQWVVEVFIRHFFRVGVRLRVRDTVCVRERERGSVRGVKE